MNPKLSMRKSRGTGNIFRISRRVNFRYPIFLDLAGKKCLAIGDHPEMAAKVEGLRDAGARVEWKRDNFDPDDLSGCFLVIASLSDNSEIFRLCEQRNILCNAVDDPEHCRFSFGSVHRAGDLTIAISTNGIAPALAVRLRERLKREIGVEYGELLAILEEARPEIQSRISEFAARRDLWYRILDSNVLELVRLGRSEAARAVIQQLINSTSHSHTSGGDADR